MSTTTTSPPGAHPQRIAQHYEVHTPFSAAMDVPRAITHLPPSGILITCQPWEAHTLGEPRRLEGTVVAGLAPTALGRSAASLHRRARVLHP